MSKSHRSHFPWNSAERRIKRAEIFQEQGAKCKYCCSTEELTLDHIIPLVMGGAKGQKHNIQVLCDACNNQKSKIEQRAAIEMGLAPPNRRKKNA